MSIVTISGRDFNQDVAGAKRAAEKGPDIITDRGMPAFVLQRQTQLSRTMAILKPRRRKVTLASMPSASYQRSRSISPDNT